MIDRDVVLSTLKCSSALYPRTLDEKFPHVLEKIVELWFSPEVKVYLADLLQPNGRGGGRLDRSGFPDEAWVEILLLQQLRYRQSLH